MRGPTVHQKSCGSDVAKAANGERATTYEWSTVKMIADRYPKFWERRGLPVPRVSDTILEAAYIPGEFLGGVNDRIHRHVRHTSNE